MAKTSALCSKLSDFLRFSSFPICTFVAKISKNLLKDKMHVGIADAFCDIDIFAMKSLREVQARSLSLVSNSRIDFLYVSSFSLLSETKEKN